MKTLIVILLWFILLLICWPLAFGLFFLLPVIWIIILPFKLVGYSIDLIFKILGAVLLFPFKLLKAI